jgi:serine O-acetyltransferase
MFKTMMEDIRAVIARDPAARSKLEILLCYAGLHAVWGHRVAHRLWTLGFRLLARWLSHVNRALTGIEIHPGARIGPRFFIDHGMGVVIGETAEIGADVTLYHGVTLGGVSLEKGKRHPTLEEGVVVGAGAKILGDITIGRCSRIGGNAVVVKPVPPESVVVGVPGEVVKRKGERRRPEVPDLEHGRLPDVLGDALVSLMKRVDTLEHRVSVGVGVGPGEGGAEADPSRETREPSPHIPDHGVWRGEDFDV